MSNEDKSQLVQMELERHEIPLEMMSREESIDLNFLSNYLESLGGEFEKVLFENLWDLYLDGI